MTDIKWQNPPQHKSRKSDWANIAEALRQRPNEWALVKERCNGSVASAIRGGVITAFRPASSFEARTSSVGNGKHDVYARFVGEVSS